MAIDWLAAWAMKKENTNFMGINHNQIFKY